MLQHSSEASGAESMRQAGRQLGRQQGGQQGRAGNKVNKPGLCMHVGAGGIGGGRYGALDMAV